MYVPGVVVPVVEIIAVAFPVAVGVGVTDGGLTWHAGGVTFDMDEVAWHVRLTVPVKPVPAVTTTGAVAENPGFTATGVNFCGIVSVKSGTAATDTKVREAAERHSMIALRRAMPNFRMDGNEENLNMNSFGSTSFDS